jgi:NAD(P)-dependent dehydrogenase (short-subunit alcohol dehydrogenase family)
MTDAPDSNICGRHALVTGGGSGIGKAIAAALSAQGAAVSLLARSRDRLEAARTELDLTGGIAVADVAHGAQVEAAVAELRAQHGPVAILVNNAGAAESAPFHATAPDLWERMLAVNLTGTYNVTRAALGDVVGTPGGRIVNVASTAALKGYSYVSAYCAAKHGVVGLTRALATELARKDVTVNAVCPGYTDTDLLDRSLDKIMQTAGLGEAEARAALAAVNPQGRFIEPHEVARTIVWLCGGAARGITGQAIAVAGGEVM